MKNTHTVRLQTACSHLRHKLMYIDDRQSTPGLVDASSSTRIFFCVKSQDSIALDGNPVSPSDCTPDRPCYCAARNPSVPT